MGSAHEIDIGRLVVRDLTTDIGRVGAVKGSQVRIDYFESAAEPIAASEWVTPAECRPISLPRQTRVFWQEVTTRRWRMGRVVGASPSGYFIRAPHVDYDLLLEEVDLRVRWDRPVSSPIDVLLAGANESPYYGDARLPMLQSLVTQRAACASMATFISSAVEIFPHQVDAALTVLSDPVPRYLLADEVGLGKTIEAGYVIRQVLLDNARSRVAVVAPDVLRRQWRAELKYKFFIDDFPHATIKITAHETPERWERYRGFDLVVVDEAQRLTQVDGPEESPYGELRALAASCPRLLLLSATPATRRLNTHLGLLHLLDPDLYRWEHRESFKERFGQRKELARHLYALTSDDGLEFLLPVVIDDIVGLVPYDDRLAELASSVSELLDGDGGLRDVARRPDLEVAVEALRAHISETYRLHRRVIRHRRSRVLAKSADADADDIVPFEVRGRIRPTAVPIDSPQHRACQDALLDWQTRVADLLRNFGKTDQMEEYGQALAVLASRSGAAAVDLLDAFRWRLSADSAAADRAGLTQQERAMLSGPGVLRPEHDVFAELTDVCQDSGIHHLADAIVPVLTGSQRAVVFCGAGSLCADLADELAGTALAPRILEHSLRVGPEASEEAVIQWTEHGGVLITDASAEDGLNLQHADSVVHCRLPWSPNRLEQILGRVDRYPGMAQPHVAGPAEQYVVSGDDAEIGFGDAWLELLDQGFGIFRTSVSALQDAIDGTVSAVWRAAVADGPHGLISQSAAIAELLVEERKEIDGMDVLESVHESAIQLRDIAASLGSYETNGWRDLEAALVGYAGEKPGGLRFRVRQTGSPQRRFIEFSRGDRAPLVSPRLFTIAGTRLDPEQMAGMLNRTAVLRRPGNRLFRSGHPFVGLLDSVIKLDDRGQATAFWRIPSRPLPEPEIYLRLHYLVEAEIANALSHVHGAPNAENAIRRQADRLLAPFLRQVWLAGDGGPVREASLLALLDRPYRNGIDVNLNADRIDVLYNLFGGQEWFGRKIQALEKAGRAELRRVSDLTRRCQEAQEQARRVTAIMRAQAAARRAAGRLVGDAEGHITDLRIAEALIDGLAAPKVSLVSVTCLVVGDAQELRRGNR